MGHEHPQILQLLISRGLPCTYVQKVLTHIILGSSLISLSSLLQYYVHLVLLGQNNIVLLLNNSRKLMHLFTVQIVVQPTLWKSSCLGSRSPVTSPEITGWVCSNES